ncbi:hypothetical protein PARPLA_00160 [Rhodobacteraceae bacterium THAF1]|uniref:SIMPL domain-containing protein n=1 Tax=Palleronia sp. THAF1 TaxID=2587842 RepID=UPI000F419023|nr:SIMPL domain-containing protein [Palleronia sp. THAF1]QFU10275.1 hypothetical protein FIU81_16460 [Palleronia sp. THAF1]VDC16820.1 hypothetical protein PARPLA_00160 [Rhodobacteraceae bacterium THAF1]
MNAIADGLLIAGAIGVAFYCFVLSRRLTRFTDLDRGVGGAVAMLSSQVDDLRRALDDARSTAESSGQSLEDLTDRADAVARRLELQVASLQDIAEPPAPTEPAPMPANRASAAPATQSFFSRRSVGVTS